MMTTEQESPTTAVEKMRDRFEVEDLRQITSFEDAVRLAGEMGDIADATQEIGDGFTMCEDKDLLLKVPFILMQWGFTPGDYGDDYCIARVVTQTGAKLIITDGGTGFSDQLKDYEQRTGRTSGLYVARGLRKSEYDKELENGETVHGVTYYLNV